MPKLPPLTFRAEYGSAQKQSFDIDLSKLSPADLHYLARLGAERLISVATINTKPRLPAIAEMVATINSGRLPAHRRPIPRPDHMQL